MTSLSLARAGGHLDFDASTRALISTFHSAIDQMTNGWVSMDDDSQRTRLFASLQMKDQMEQGRSMAL